MKPALKVHLLGPITGGGFYRTLCERSLEGLEATRDPGKVDCAICQWRMRRAALRAK